MYRKIQHPRPERFPKGGDFAPRGPRDFPRAKPEGNLEGQCIPTRVSVRTFSHPRQGGIRFNTVRLHCLGVVVGVVGLMGEVEVVRGKLKGNLEGEG